MNWRFWHSEQNKHAPYLPPPPSTGEPKALHVEIHICTDSNADELDVFVQTIQATARRGFAEVTEVHDGVRGFPQRDEAARVVLPAAPLSRTG